MRRILVTGGAGFIGSHFVRHILTKHDDYEVINLDKLTYAGNPDNLRDIEGSPLGKRYRFVKGDVCDEKLVAELVGQVDAIVNFAAETHVDRSLMEPAAFIRTDVHGTYVLLSAAAAAGGRIERVLHISTDEVYGDIPAPRLSQEERPSASPQPLLGEQGGRRHAVPRLHRDVRAAGGHRPAREQRRAQPVPGEDGAALHHQRPGGRAPARLRRRAAAPRLALRDRQLRGARPAAAQGRARRGLQHRRRQREAEHGGGGGHPGPPGQAAQISSASSRTGRATTGATRSTGRRYAPSAGRRATTSTPPWRRPSPGTSTTAGGGRRSSRAPSANTTRSSTGRGWRRRGPPFPARASFPSSVSTSSCAFSSPAARASWGAS